MDFKKLTRNPLLYVALIAVFLIIGFTLMSTLGGAKQITTQQGLDLLAGNTVTEVVNTDGDQRVDMTLSTPYEGATDVQFYYVTARAEEVVNAIDAANPADGYNDVVPRATWFDGFLSLFLPILLLGVLFWFLLSSAQGGGSKVMQFGRSRAKLVTKESPTVTFDDVAGSDEAIEELQEIKDFLKEPAKFQAVGARIPKGVLLYGPPGTGKTLLARAVAGEAGVPFYSISGSDFVEMFVGVGASRVRDLFNQAKESAPAIIFIDEIDAVGRHRGAGMGGGHDEREQTLNQMLVEMDGFDPKANVIVIAATNRPDILDPALLRPGRFDRQVMVPLPELEDRRQILEVHTKGKQVGDDVDLGVVARGAPGMSGADLANLVNEAALTAVRAGDDAIRAEHLDVARDRILMGQKRESMALTDDDKEKTAYHEAGHAICAAVLPNADPVHKVTIIPRGRALGVTMMLPERDRHTSLQDHLEDELVVCMGGRVAEDLVFGVLANGAHSDLVYATESARRMVREWGMSDVVGPMAWSNRNQVFLGDEMLAARDYSDETARVIDKEIQRILVEQEKRCRDLLTKHRQALDLVARALLEHETISGDEVDRLIGAAAGGTDPTQGNGSSGDTAVTVEPEPAEDPTPVD